jgi:choline-glycine betaine transporter
MFFFLLYIVYRYGHVHFGRPRRRRHQRQPKPPPGTADASSPPNDQGDTEQLDPPDFSTLWYACMIFAGGIGAGFLGTTVTQVLSSRTDHFYAQTGYRSQDELDLFALTMTMNMWGIAGWAPYLLVAVNMCLAVHCYHLPLALRSCLFPILGHYTWGWMGDLIDSLAIVSTVSGVATAMALGSTRIVSGFVYLEWIDHNATPGHVLAIQNATIWIITIISAAAVLSGFNGSVRILSGVAIAVSSLLLLVVFISDDSKFLLNLIVQEAGHYLQLNLFQLNLWTDAFGQLREGSGRAIDGKAAAQWWME